MDRARAAAVYVLTAAAIVIAWLRIEGPPRETGLALFLALLAMVPVLAVRLWVRLALVVAACVVGSWVALGASVATPGRVATRLFDGSGSSTTSTSPSTRRATPGCRARSCLPSLRSASCSRWLLPSDGRYWRS